MKRLLLILILTLSVQTLSRADDIRDFEIEGMSVGDSLLDFFTEDLIKKEIALDDDGYKNKEYLNLWFDGDGKFKTYQYLQVHIKSNDKNYIAQSIEGKIIYKDNIEDCYEKKKIIFNELKNIFPTANVRHSKSKHQADPSGKSLTDTSYFFLSNNTGNIGVACYDWSKEFGKYDNLKVFIDKPEFLNWLKTKAYK